MRPVVPLANLQRRLPEAGRIRTGKRGARGAPQAIPAFRFTSHDAVVLGQIAEMYGGTVQPWSDPKAADGQHEVITEAPAIRVILPPDPLGDSPVYEMWGGGGCERRCDGVTVQTWTRGPDGPEPTDSPCICAAKGALACKVTTRLSVILPEVNFAGVWRLDTKSDNAARELPGMVDLIRDQQTKGLPYATLTLRPHRSVQAGQTRKFLVPTLGVDASIEALASGAASVGSLPAPAPTPEIGPGVVEQAYSDPDDEIADAEVVDEDQDALAARLAALPTRARNKAEKLRHNAGIARLDEDPEPDDLTAWGGLLRGLEAEVATA